MPLLKRNDPVDACIIGAGASGAVVAKKLGEAGLKVVVLDAGPRFTPERDYRTAKPDFEVTGPRVFQTSDPRRDRYTWEGVPWFRYSRVKGIGGSTLIYVGVSPRFHASDFRLRTLEGVADDWPFRYRDLAPYYDEIERDLGVAGENNNPFDVPRGPYPNPPHPFNCASLTIKRGCEKLGWHLVHSPLANISRNYDGRPACIRCGACRMGCLIRAKSSVDVVYIPKAEATQHVEIRPECMAREITLDAQGRAGSVIYFDPNGVEREQKARVIVLAANAVETPRLLLMSTSNRFPDGLANRSGLVGRYFMEHLAVFGWAIFPERINAYQGIPAGGMIQDFYETRPEHDFVRGWMFEVNNGWEWPLSVARRLPGWGQEHKERMREVFGHMTGLATVGEQLPDKDNRIVLDPEVTDNYDLPVPRIAWRLSENDERMIKAIKQRMVELFQAAGAEEIIEPRFVPGGSSHYMGTCRMGENPDSSVVDPWCRSHDVPNLFIVDSSVFVTGAAVNPALTIQAIAARAADYMVESGKRGEL
ncbi:MAG TPA: GMC family oxidoreductase [Anaerolineae bacterium]|nr:GMC family oxidoreductase [Anaerolineae bacterium]